MRDTIVKEINEPKARIPKLYNGRPKDTLDQRFSTVADTW